MRTVKHLSLWIFIAAFSGGLAVANAAGTPRNPEEQNWAYDVQVFRLNALHANISLRKAPEPDLYFAEMEIKPSAILRTVGPYRRIHLLSTLRYIPQTARLRLERLEKNTWGRRTYQGFYDLDYVQKRVRAQGAFDGKPLEVEEFPLDEKNLFYDDFLSFFFNLRMGSFDTLKPGESLTIHGIPGKKVSTFALARTDHHLAKRPDDASRAFRLEIRRDILGMQIEDFLIWVREDDVPLVATAPDVFGWGDIVSVLRTKKP